MRRGRIRWLGWLAALALAACQPEAPRQPTDGGGGGTAASPAPAASPSAAEARMLELVNQERRERGLQPLEWDPQLAAIAEAHAADMIARNYFAHEAPKGATVADRARKAGIPYWLLGENLGVAPTVGETHRGLMNSPSHRENILRPEFTHIGIGIVEVEDDAFRPEHRGEALPVPPSGLEGYVVATQVFSKPR